MSEMRKRCQRQLNRDASDETASRFCLKKELAHVHGKVHISHITGSALSVGVGG